MDASRGLVTRVRVGGMTQRAGSGAHRGAAVIAGWLFIVATAATLLGTALEQSMLSGTAFLSRIADSVSRVSAAGLLELIAAAASAGIAIALYPVLRRWSAGLALGAVVFRTIEAVMYIVGAACMLAVLTVATGAARAPSQAVADALVAMRQWAILLAVFAFVVGALMYYAVFYRSRLVPRWLSGWGIAAALVMLAACLAALFSRNAVTSYTILAIPIAVQEIVLAAWLIARGFNAPPLTHDAAAALDAG